MGKISRTAVCFGQRTGGFAAWVLFLMVATLALSACGGGGSGGSAAPRASLTVALDRLVTGGNAAARIGTLPEEITRVTIEVTDTNAVRVAFIELTGSDSNTVTLDVPSGTALVVIATAYTGESLFMQGSTNVAALDAGASGQIQVTLTAGADGPVIVVEPPSNSAAAGPSATRLTAGGRHSCVIRGNGTLWCWGDNFNGQTGSGAASDFEAAPVQEATGATNWSVVESGSAHTCALRADGSLWCWGSDYLGQLGDGAAANGELLSLVPVRESTAATNWATVTSGDMHTCALRADGSLWCWGNNFRGQLGNGAAGADAHQNAPVREATSATDWAAVSAGGFHTCAVKTNGTLWCWGYNWFGQLGDGTSGDSAHKSVPTQVGTDTNWTLVDAGFQHTCAVKSNGTLWCWGYNWYGQLGDGTSGDGSNRAVPTQEQTAATDWTGVATGGFFTCALRGATARYCWGRNSEGQYGNGTRNASLVPVAVDAAAQAWTAIAVGGRHSCGLIQDTTLSCWGSNAQGQLGIGQAGYQTRLAPEQVETARTWASVAVGAQHACGTDGASALWCWGKNDKGELGIGAATPNMPLDRAQAVVAGADDGWKGASADFLTTCALKTNNTLWCWGDNDFGQLGNNDAPNARAAPAQEATGAQDWTSVSTHGLLSCGIRGAGTLWCWGGGAGFGAATPTQEPSAATNWARVSVGEDHVCAIKTNGTLWCFGGNLYGQLGNNASGADAEQLIPVQENTQATDWAQVSVGYGFSCATKTGGTLWCWGRNSFGQLGNAASGEDADSSVPVREATNASTWNAIAAGHEHACATRSDGSLWCWGGNAYGQLGNGDHTDASSPVRESGAATTWSQLSAGLTSTCAVRNNSSLWCWGDNAYGQLGDGYAWRDEPTVVLADVTAP